MYQIGIEQVPAPTYPNTEASDNNYRVCPKYWSFLSSTVQWAFIHPFHTIQILKDWLQSLVTLFSRVYFSTKTRVKDRHMISTWGKKGNLSWEYWLYPLLHDSILQTVLQFASFFIHTKEVVVSGCNIVLVRTNEVCMYSNKNAPYLNSICF